MHEVDKNASSIKENRVIKLKTIIQRLHTRLLLFFAFCLQGIYIYNFAQQIETLCLMKLKTILVLILIYNGVKTFLKDFLFGKQIGES